MSALPIAAVVLAFQQLVGAPQAGATIQGRVFDPDGRPMAHVLVMAMDGATEKVTILGASDTSGPDGRFLLTRVRPGKVIVRVQPQTYLSQSGTPPRRTSLIHPPVFFPGVTERADAWVFDAAAGETLELDIHVPPVFVASVRAVVHGPEKYQLEYLRVTRPEANLVRNIRLNDEGVGYADDLREGRFAVVARARAGKALVAAWQTVDLLHGEMEVSLHLVPTATIRGRVVVEQGVAPSLDGVRVLTPLSQYGIELDPLGFDQANVAADGSFAIAGLYGTRTIRVAGLPDGWNVRSVRRGRVEISGSEFDVAPEEVVEVTVVVAR